MRRAAPGRLRTWWTADLATPRGVADAGTPGGDPALRAGRTAEYPDSGPSTPYLAACVLVVVPVPAGRALGYRARSSCRSGARMDFYARGALLAIGIFLRAPGRFGREWHGDCRDIGGSLQRRAASSAGRPVGRSLAGRCVLPPQRDGRILRAAGSPTTASRSANTSRPSCIASPMSSCVCRRIPSAFSRTPLRSSSAR